MHWPVPLRRVDADLPETACRLHLRDYGLADSAKTGGEKGFVVPTTGTAMQWAPPGTVERAEGGDAAVKARIGVSRGFWIARYETTQLDWMTLMPSNPSQVTGSPFLPVDSVSWEDAGRFCMLLNQQESKAKRIPAGYAFRLPTECEWEYACRAGNAGAFGVDSPGFWSAENSDGRPHEVGEGSPNAWKLYDMHGNVPEWCLDAWRDEASHRGTDLFVRPTNEDDCLVVRGGGWWDGSGGCSALARERSRNEVGGYRGFRIVLAPLLQ